MALNKYIDHSREELESNDQQHQQGAGRSLKLSTIFKIEDFIPEAFKILVIGQVAVGKTTIVSKLTHGSFPFDKEKTHKPTVCQSMYLEIF
ncbi:hypothetical protein DFA_01256 [Cavenderia fasciculata]|uniref:Uncharacterized protein n=1 Tax=Cavenderia fasciculata TaxID=261658 RepID=F4PRT9_CACFS|nr:uncharacterized protein DFA_01256 [Cavenderia fasciculata]EGG21375.1 hypothetical protein DFA_01256 [Cavenderia fasciculata]|eukprot:XP_004359225.1 hypothetical protein DFA_01256 [Cavenderia fasciculata]